MRTSSTMGPQSNSMFNTSHEWVRRYWYINGLIPIEYLTILFTETNHDSCSTAVKQSTSAPIPVQT